LSLSENRSNPCPVVDTPYSAVVNAPLSAPPTSDLSIAVVLPAANAVLAAAVPAFVITLVTVPNPSESLTPSESGLLRMCQNRYIQIFR